MSAPIRKVHLMWTSDNRARYDRSALRYPSDLTDEEWSRIGPLSPPARRGGLEREVDIREVVNGVMHLLSTCCQWRYLPKDLPPKSTVISPGGIVMERYGRSMIDFMLNVACKPGEKPVQAQV